MKEGESQVSNKFQGREGLYHQGEIGWITDELGGEKRENSEIVTLAFY